MYISNAPILRKFAYDDETGEIITYEVNGETGEPILENNVAPLHFRGYESANNEEGNYQLNDKYMKFPRGYMSKTKKFQSLKANILAGSNQISHRLLLIPTLMIFPALFCAFLMVLEVFLHVRCHKKNKKLKDPNLYYRSPFHVVTSIFCGVCRDCNTASKIGQMQDQRRNRYDYFRGIAI